MEIGTREQGRAGARETGNGERETGNGKRETGNGTPRGASVPGFLFPCVLRFPLPSSVLTLRPTRRLSTLENPGLAVAAHDASRVVEVLDVLAQLRDVARS